MKRSLFVWLACALIANPLLAATDDDQVEARRAALDLAGAWTNDGFKLRDGHLVGNFQVGEPKLVRVNLYAGNQYWFTVAATPKAKKLSIQVFDEGGKPLAFEPYADDSRAAAGFAPTASGSYLIKVEELEGEPSAFAIVYSYR
jgi:hypothetical protein